MRPDHGSQSLHQHLGTGGVDTEILLGGNEEADVALDRDGQEQGKRIMKTLVGRAEADQSP